MYKAYRSTIERKNQLRWQRIVRLETAGLPTEQIAKLSGYTYDQVRRTLESRHYQEWRNARLSNRVSAIDEALSADTEQMRTALRELVPVAIRTLEKALDSPDALTRLRAATEILDRDNRFTKSQNIAVKHELVPAKELESARKLARELRKHTIDVSPEVSGAPVVTPKLLCD